MGSAVLYSGLIGYDIFNHFAMSSLASTTSVRQDTLRVPTYHDVTSAQYTLPNDAPEHVRLEEQAGHLSAIMNDQVIHAPLHNPARLLEVGCGTGYLTTHLGTIYPNADVVGLDLSTVPELRIRPRNVRFLKGDVMSQTPQEWTPQSGTDLVKNDDRGFDYLFSRLLICGMNDWPGYLRKAFSLLNADGWAEMHDLDWVWFDASSGRVISDDWEWLKVLKSAAEERRLDFEGGSGVKGWMADAGFVDVKRCVHARPSMAAEFSDADNTSYEYRWPFGGAWEEEPQMKAFGDYVAREMPEMFHHV